MRQDFRITLNSESWTLQHPLPKAYEEDGFCRQTCSYGVYRPTPPPPPPLGPPLGKIASSTTYEPQPASAGVMEVMKASDDPKSAEDWSPRLAVDVALASQVFRIKRRSYQPIFEVLGQLDPRKSSVVQETSCQWSPHELGPFMQKPVFRLFIERGNRWSDTCFLHID